MKLIRRTVTSILVSIPLLASCATDVDETTDVRDSSTTPAQNSTTVREYRVPERLENSTIVWSAEPGIDLFSPEATVVRAAIEARQVALATSLAESYPGYENAVDPDTRAYFAEKSWTSWPEYGTAYHHIANLDPTDEGFVAHVCLQLSGIASLKDDNSFYRTLSPAFLTSTLTIESSDAGTNPPSGPPSAAPTETEIPHWQAPNFDVFEGWKLSFGPPFGTDHAAVCTAWGHPLAPDAPSEGTRSVSSETPPETLPAYPGW